MAGDDRIGRVQRAFVLLVVATADAASLDSENRAVGTYWRDREITTLQLARTRLNHGHRFLGQHRVASSRL